MGSPLPFPSQGDPEVGVPLWALAREAAFLLPPGGAREAQVCVVGAGDGAEPARLPQSAEEGGVGVDLGSLCRPRP